MREIWWALTKNGSDIKNVINTEHLNKGEELWKNFQDGVLAAWLLSPEVTGGEGVTLINHATVKYQSL